MAEPPPPLSVLLPVRNGAPHLDECLASLAEQTLADFEVVVVDDGSEDATPAILAAWAERDSRIRVVRQGAQGIVSALERARGAAAAPLLARMDADDVAHPTRLESQVGALREHPDWGVCGCGVRAEPRSDLKDGGRRYEAWLNGLTTPLAVERDLFVECPLAHPTFLLRAEAAGAVGGYRQRGWPEDYDLLLRLWAGGWRLGTVPEVLLTWRERPGRLSRLHPDYSADAFRRCKIHHLKRTLLVGRRGLLVWGAGPTGKAFARMAAAQGVVVRAFVDLDPRKIGQMVQGAPVLAPDGVEGYRDALVVAAVGQPGARGEIRRALRARGWSEMTDFVAVA